MKKLIKSIKDRIKGNVPLFSRRSSHWPAVRNKFLAKTACCAACGTAEKLEVHHIMPFHMDRSLELDEGNLIVLCEGFYKCHLKVGHLGSFKKANPDVRFDAEVLRKSRSPLLR